MPSVTSANFSLSMSGAKGTSERSIRARRALVFGEPEFNLGFKSAGSKQRGVDEVCPVCGPDHRHVAAVGDSIHFGEEGRHHGIGHVGCGSSSHRCQCVDLVEEDDRGGCGPGPGEHLPHTPLRLTHVLVEQLRSLDREKRSTCLVGEGANDKCLAGAWRSVEKDASGRVDPHRLEAIGLVTGTHPASIKRGFDPSRLATLSKP